jgi:hypothetical protein
LRFANPSYELVMLREGGASSTLRPIEFITGVSGILDHPPEPVIGRREPADPVAGDDDLDVCSTPPPSSSKQKRPAIARRASCSL